ncbi:MAG: class I SAM-dependent methyltransferase [Mycobacteriaceae bacterium]|nr:class I SAM-dependent methyltransferase [Mycobacteriaceae bacterium]
MTDRMLSWRYAEEFVAERDDIALVRQHSLELGVEPIPASMGAQLAMLAAATAPDGIIEIGTGIGVSGLWLLSAAKDATLTTIDVELDYQQLARKAFLEAGVPQNRFRLIGGRASDVLPRMNEASYDLVFIDADPASVLEYVEHGIRLVRTGGTVLVAHALWRGRVADPAQRDDTVAGFRLLLSEIAASEAVIAALSPVGDGLLQLTKVSD